MDYTFLLPLIVSENLPISCSAIVTICSIAEQSNDLLKHILSTNSFLQKIFQLLDQHEVSKIQDFTPSLFNAVFFLSKTSDGANAIFSFQPLLKIMISYLSADLLFIRDNSNLISMITSSVLYLIYFLRADQIELFLPFLIPAILSVLHCDFQTTNSISMIICDLIEMIIYLIKKAFSKVNEAEKCYCISSESILFHLNDIVNRIGTYLGHNYGTITIKAAQLFETIFVYYFGVIIDEKNILKSMILQIPLNFIDLIEPLSNYQKIEKDSKLFLTLNQDLIYLLTNYIAFDPGIIDILLENYLSLIIPYYQKGPTILKDAFFCLLWHIIAYGTNKQIFYVLDNFDMNLLMQVDTDNSQLLIRCVLPGIRSVLSILAKTSNSEYQNLQNQLENFLFDLQDSDNQIVNQIINQIKSVFSIHFD